MKRGDVVVVEFPYADGRRGKNRPAIIIQNDRDNRRMTNTVVAMISGNVRHAEETSQVLVDPNAEVGRSSGLHGASIVECCNLYTVRQADNQRTIGQFSPQLMSHVNMALKSALGLES